MKVLVIKLASLGDVVQTTPVLAPLKSRGHEVHFLVSENCSDMVRNHPAIDRLISIPTLGLNPFRDALTLMRLWVLLRRGRYDAALLFHRNPILGFLLFLAGIPLRIGFYYGKRNAFLTSSVLFDLGKHRMERNGDLLRAFDSSLKPSSCLSFFTSREADRKVLGKHGLKPGSFIVSAPGGGKNPWSEMKSRRWPPGRYAELYDLIQKKHKLRLVIVGSPDEAPLAREIIGRMTTSPVNLSGKLSLIELGSVLKKSRLFIGGDSAPLFIAAAVGTPTIGIFGPTDGRIINPLGPNNLYLQAKVECSPCYSPIQGVRGRAFTCPRRVCMESIAVEDVLKRVRMLL